MQRDSSHGRTIACVACESIWGLTLARRLDPFGPRDALDPLRPNGRNARTEGPLSGERGGRAGQSVANGSLGVGLCLAGPLGSSEPDALRGRV